METLLDSQYLFDEHAFRMTCPYLRSSTGQTARSDITLGVWQTSQFLGLYDVHGDPLYTTVWGYGTGDRKHELSRPDNSCLRRGTDNGPLAEQPPPHGTSSAGRYLTALRRVDQPPADRRLSCR